MALHSRSVLHMFLPLLVALFLLFNLSAADVGRARTGGWKPVDPKDKEVQEIGEFAVTEHNKEAKTNLKYDQVVKGEVQVVSGLNYRLIIAATDDGSNPGKYEAIVWDQPWKKFRNLTSFEPVQ